MRFRDKVALVTGAAGGLGSEIARAFVADGAHESAVIGSSYCHLPQPLRWFSGDIGIHHIHHLSSRVPNYRLQDCLDDIPALQSLNRINIRQAMDCFRLALWDETTQRLISFERLRQMRAAAA